MNGGFVTAAGGDSFEEHVKFWSSERLNRSWAVLKKDPDLGRQEASLRTQVGLSSCYLQVEG